MKINLSYYFVIMIMPTTLFAASELKEAPSPWDVRPDVKVTPTNIKANQPKITPSSVSLDEWYRKRTLTVNKPAGAIELIRVAAKGGDRDSQYEMGLLYQTGAGVPQNLDTAVEWFKKAANTGNSDAQYALALIYRGTQNGYQNHAEANHWHKEAAINGNIDAQYGLGLLYANGQYMSQNVQQARAWFQKAADRGHISAKLALFSTIKPIAVSKQNIPQTKTITIAKVQQKPIIPARIFSVTPKANTDLSVNPAILSEQGRVIQKKAETGEVQAQLTLGALFEEGKEGFTKDIQQALKWYLKAANQGNSKAQYNVALLYEDGQGVTQDYQKAADWYSKAAVAGFSKAQNNLGVLYITGQGVTKNKALAKKYFQDAAKQGNKDASRNLNLLLQG